MALLLLLLLCVCVLYYCHTNGHPLAVNPYTVTNITHTSPPLQMHSQFTSFTRAKRSIR